MVSKYYGAQKLYFGAEKLYFGPPATAYLSEAFVFSTKERAELAAEIHAFYKVMPVTQLQLFEAKLAGK